MKGAARSITASKLILACFLIYASPCPGASTVLESQIEGTCFTNFHDAQFRLWIPQTSNNPATQNPASILCYLSGSGMNALGLENDPGWQHLAADLNACLLTIHFRDSGTGKSWHQAEAGSGQALLDALKDLSLKSGIPGLDKLPIAFAGLSTGGQYSYHWACWKPDQTLCFISLKGGKHSEAFQPQILKIPGLWIAADQDLEYRQKNIKAVFDKHKAKGAPWTYVSEPKAGHESENASRLIGPYLKAVLLNSKNENPISKDSSFMSTGVKADDSKVALPGSPSSTNSPLSKGDFTRLLRDFEEGKSLETWPPLPLNSAPLPDYAFTSPATLDFGSCESGQLPTTLEIQLAAKEGSPVWDRVELADPDKLWEQVEAPQAGKAVRFRLRLKLRPDQPLGIFKTLSRFRFYQGNRLLLGGLNLPAMIRVSGDVEVTPGSLYLGVLDGKESISKTLTIKSKGGFPLKWISGKSSVPDFIRIEPSTLENGNLQLRCSFHPTTTSQLEAENAGRLQLCFQSDREWTVLVPAILSLKNL